MDITSALIIVLGLALFESIISIDNAIINAEVLQGMKPRAAEGKFILKLGSNR